MLIIILIILVVLTLPARYCALLNCESFLRVDIVFLCNSCVGRRFSFEWNKEILGL